MKTIRTIWTDGGRRSGLRRAILCGIVLAMQPAAGYGHQESPVTAHEVTKDERMVRVSLVVDAERLAPTSNRSVTLEPLLTDGRDTVWLSPLTVSGRRRHLMTLRALRRYGLADPTVRYRKGEMEPIDYRTTTAYAPWMDGAMLQVREVWCGCGGHAEERYMREIGVMHLLAERYHPDLRYAYAVPEPEEVKVRNERATARLDYGIGRTEIDPMWGNNPAELAKIRATIDRLREDPDLRVDRISIHGYASPEGRASANERLAAARAAALKGWLLGSYPFDEGQIEVSSTAEDWETLRRMADTSSLAQSGAIVTTIDTVPDADEREQRLRRLDGGMPWRRMVQEWFPALRRSDYTVTFTVRPFDVAEARRLIVTAPQKLSLNEMYRVARECEPGSEEFERVFDIAVRMYPSDPAANLNAANVAMREGQLPKAQDYLRKAGDSPEAIHARGVLALLSGDYPAARRLLEEARAAGVREAAHNLLELDRLEQQEAERQP